MSTGLHHLLGTELLRSAREGVGARPARLTTGVLLLLVLVSGFALRSWYGSHRLHKHRFEDERYAIANVRSILVGRTFVPASSYYPSPVFNLPLAAVVAASERFESLTGRPSFNAFEDGNFTYHGYLLMRLLQAVYGTAAVWMVFLLGHRLFGSAAGLTAALLLAFVPWHIHASGYIKPDALLTLTVLAAMYCGIRLLEAPGWRWAAATGVAIALAASAKLTGVLVAAPVTAAMLFLAWRSRQRLTWLVATGALAAATFVLANPNWRAYPTWIASLSRDYAMRAGHAQMTHVQVPAKAIEYLADRYVFGWPLTGLALLGLGVVVVALWRAAEPVRRVQLFTLAALPLVWVGGYAVQTAYFKPNNMLPILGPLAVLAAVALHGLWNSCLERLPVLRRQVFAWACVAVFAAVVVRPGLLYVYRSLTPSTLDLAQGALRSLREFPAGRLVWYASGRPQLPNWDTSRTPWRPHPATVRVRSLANFTAERLARADAVVLPTTHLQRQRGAPVRTLLQETTPQITQVNRRLFRVRGPTLTVLLRPWVRLGVASGDLEVCGDDCVDTWIPGRSTSLEHASLMVWLPTTPGSAPPAATTTLDGRPLELHFARARRDGWLYTSERFPLGEGSLHFELIGGPYRGPVKVAIHRWSPPKG